MAWQSGETERSGALHPTPTHVVGQERRMGGFSCLAEGLDFAARCATGVNFYSGRGKLQAVLPYATLREEALVLAGKLRAAGLAPGNRIALVAETAPSFMIAFFACQYAGMLPCPVPLPMQIGGRDSYIARVAGMLRAAQAHLLLVPGVLKDKLQEAAAAAGVPLLDHETLATLPEAAGAINPLRADDPAYIQYSSGSTSAPKGILISQRAIMANTTGILRHGLRAQEDDRGFSWLPLYHDMGLVGFFLSPVMGQSSVDYMATADFAKRPTIWLQLMSDNRCTASYAPSFGYELAARRINGKAETLDLSQWRIAGIGGDMVRPEVLDAFARALAPAGFDPRAFLPSYGMAEMSLAVSFADLDSPMRTDVVDREAARNDGVARPAPADAPQARTFVSCGRVLPGHEMKVVDENGKELPERHIGHILVKGPSMMSGYFGNPEATAAAMRDGGFLDTGDLGYMLDGEIYITGRSKDMILHHGRNIWPQDIEWAVERLPGLRSGDAAAFGVEREDGTERIVVLVQCRKRDAAAQEALRRSVAKVVHEVTGAECEVVLVAPRSLPLTSSGKLARSRARQLYLNGEMPLCAQAALEEAAPAA